jgi:DNA-binding protein H-NS
MKIKVEELSPRQLEVLLVAAERRKTQLAKRRPLAIVRAELIAFAAGSGYTIEELVGEQSTERPSPTKRAAKQKTGKTGKVAAKYRDPDSKRDTWSGRGSMPRWLAEKVKRGRSATDFLLPGLARPTAKKSKTVGQKTVFKKA